MVDIVQTNALFYKIQNGTVSTIDYINWSQTLLENGVSSPSVNIISSLSFNENIFKVEAYFNRALKELALQKPSYEICARAYIGHLANKNIKENDHTVILDLAYMIFRIVSVDLRYPDDLIGWYDISEMIDELQYGDNPLKFNKEEVITRIKDEADEYFDK